MKVFVTGGTGAIGGHLVPALVREGHAVTALARTPEKAAVLAAQGATPVVVSLVRSIGVGLGVRFPRSISPTLPPP
jgi:uncharacterized protein YbjT (DUF2867 family)